MKILFVVCCTLLQFNLFGYECRSAFRDISHCLKSEDRGGKIWYIENTDVIKSTLENKKRKEYKPFNAYRDKDCETHVAGKHIKLDSNMNYIVDSKICYTFRNNNGIRLNLLRTAINEGNYSGHIDSKTLSDVHKFLHPFGVRLLHNKQSGRLSLIKYVDMQYYELHPNKVQEIITSIKQNSSDFKFNVPYMFNNGHTIAMNENLQIILDGSVYNIFKRKCAIYTFNALTAFIAAGPNGISLDKLSPDCFGKTCKDTNGFVEQLNIILINCPQLRVYKNCNSIYFYVHDVSEVTMESVEDK